MRRWCCFLALLLAVVSCGSTEPDSSVQFTMDAPFCGGSPFPWVFVVDSAEVGRESLPDKASSKLYPVTRGMHKVQVKFPSGTTFRSWTIPSIDDRSHIFEFTIDFYCS